MCPLPNKEILRSATNFNQCLLAKGEIESFPTGDDSQDMFIQSGCNDKPETTPTQAFKGPFCAC